MTCYLLHFNSPFGHARHYLGFASPGRLEQRLAEHAAGRGAKLTGYVKAAGITWTLARVWEDGTRTDERRMKQSGHSRRCPLCRAAAH